MTIEKELIMKSHRSIIQTLFLLGLWLGVGLQAQAQTGTVTYIYTDQQGTPLAEADVNGTITATFDYAPYGSQALGTAPSGVGYTGHVNDPDSGLVYMQARYYDPGTGRFLSVDPVVPAAGNAFNFSRYAYANNNPVINIDPDGKNGQLFWTASNQATLTVPYIVGLSNGAHMTMTTAQINEAVSRNLSGTVTINGANVTITAQAVEANGSNTTGITNFINVVPTTQGVTQSGRSETNQVGGDKITIGAGGNQPARPDTVSHELGHASGAGDQYAGGVDAQGNKLPQDAPGGSGIMKSLNDGPANQQTLREIIQAPTNTNTCAPGAHAENGGC